MTRSLPTAVAALRMRVLTSVLLTLATASAFSTFRNQIAFETHAIRTTVRSRTLHTPAYFSADDDGEAEGPSAMERLSQCKSDLIRCCSRSSKPLAVEVKDLVRDLESLGEQVGVGQVSSLSGLLSGEWELLYSPEDITRSSPFFWAFRRAFPDQSDQIFGITDAIPAPIKEVGPAFQTIDIDTRSTDSRATATAAGTLVSRVEVATLGGFATSIMTTRATILATEGLDGLRLRVESTKPEESTVLQKLGPLGEAIDSIAQPFPSGDALEQVRQGSSEVIMRTTYCDESLRISRNEDMFDDVYVWRRKNFDGNFEI